MVWTRMRAALPGDRARRLLLGLIALGTAAEWLGPILAGGVAAPLMRLAAGHSPSPALGAAEAGLIASAIWLVFEG